MNMHKKPNLIEKPEYFSQITACSVHQYSYFWAFRLISKQGRQVILKTVANFLQNSRFLQDRALPSKWSNTSGLPHFRDAKMNENRKIKRNY